MTSRCDSEELHWKSLARQWELFGPPLRPSPADVDVVRQLLKDFSGVARAETLAALILGVTPEYATLPWPEGTSLTALDQNPDMIQFVWPGSSASTERVVCGDWLDPHFSPRSFDLIVGDGVLSMQPFPEGYRRLATAVAVVARPAAIWSIRMYVRPDRPESPATVIDDLRANKIGSFHAFKLRLAMALHGDDDGNGVRVDDVWRYWEAAGIGVQSLVDRGWPIEVVRMIDVYRDSPARYSFPPLEAAVSVIREFAEPTQISRPTYELGERCPSVSFRFPD